jgi:hypothetical protein
MRVHLRFRFKSTAVLAGSIVGALAVYLLLAGSVAAPDLAKASASARRSATGGPQLVAMTPLPPQDGAMCEWMPASASESLLAMLQESAAADEGAARKTTAVDRPPVRVIKDTYATYSAIAMDKRTGEVMMEDENLFGIKVFNRLDNTPPSAAFTEPKRVLSGDKTRLEFNCGLYVDPKSGDVYSVNNDTTDNMVVFPYGAAGNRPPSRELHVPHGSYGIAVDETAQEMYITVEHINSVVVFHKMAQGEDQPVRTIGGAKTQLEDPHGVSLDMKDGLIFVTNHGNGRAGEEPNGYGKFDPPSITVYPIKAAGDTAPLRILEGPKTGLNWPAHIWIDEKHNEFYVANDAGNDILVFRTADSGDAAPIRRIHGAKTQIRNPMGVFLDDEHDELWVSNMGNHRATVFPRLANGDVEPKRVIRSAPPEKIALAIGNPGAVGYDNKREEILVPN